MFDYVVFKPNNKRNKPRYFTAGFSIIVHCLVLGFAIGLPILYASDALPEPPDMMAFVVEAPPPPPPPPPAPPPPEAKKPDPSPQAEPLPVAKPVPVDTTAAPVESPAEVKPETGLEGAPKTAVEAGFEKGVEGGIAGGVVGGLEGAPPPPPPPPPKPQGPVRVGGQIKAPQLTNRVNPAYPPAAQSAQVGGNVVLEATVDKSGHVTNVKVLQGQPLLNEAAIAAVKQWTYAPLMLNGEPTPFILTVTVTFTIPK
jgi:periplasmic protein TonB